MFREMIRKNKQLSREECAEVLRTALRGALSVQGDDGYPYSVPMNHWYCPEDGHIYFHGGPKGYKLDALRRDDKACFCTWDDGWKEEGDWALNIRSVVVFGRVRVVEDHDRAMEISRQLSYKFTRDEQYIADEIRRSGPATVCLELVPDHMTGKRVKES